MHRLQRVSEALAAFARRRETRAVLAFLARPAVAGPVLIVMLGAFAYAPLLRGGMILTGDNLHAWRIFELGRCLDDGQVPCRWVPDLGNGYGFPLFNYYPPFPYYVGDLLHRFGLSYVAAVNALFLVGLVGAGLSMWALTRRLWGELGGLVSAAAYMYAPYLALDVYMRGALAELWGLALAPALLWAVHELVTSGRARYVPVVALFSGLLLLSHNLIAVIMFPAVALWAAVLLTSRRERLRPALLGAAGAAWGVGLAAFFTLPVLSEGFAVQLNTVSEGPFHYSENFASVSELFLTRSDDYSFLLGGRDGTVLQIGWFHWLLAGLAMPAGVLLWRAGRRQAAFVIGTFALLFTAGVFMTISLSEGVWDTFDSLRFIQFPWRFLGLVSLASAALAGAWLLVLRDRAPWLQLGTAVVLIGVFVGTGAMFHDPLLRFDVSDEEVFSGDHFADLYRSGSINDFLPAAVEVIPEEPPESPARVVGGPAVVSSANAGSDWIDLRIEAEGPARVEAALFDFPEWRVRVDGRDVPHTASSPHGLITFTVPAGEHDVELRLRDTAVRSLGETMSLVSWLAMALAVPAMLIAPALRRRLARRGALDS